MILASKPDGGTNMQELVRMFTQEIPSPLRRGAYGGIVNAPRILVCKWAEKNCGEGDDDGCGVVVAAYAAIHKPIDADEVYSQYGVVGKEKFLAEMLCVSRESVSLCWQEWDNMDDAGREGFVAFIRQEYDALPPEGDDDVIEAQPATLRVSVMARAMANAGAIALAVAIIAATV